MRTGIFFDTETTGLPNWKEKSDSECQPHLVQLAAIVADLDTREILQSMNVIINPLEWTIPQETIDIHGITNEIANQVGIPEIQAIDMFMSMQQGSLRIAHNVTFDNRIIRIGCKRYFPDIISDEAWKDKSNYYCTYQNFKKLIGGKGGHKLIDAYKHFTSKELVGAHNAWTDTKACMDVYWGLREA